MSDVLYESKARYDLALLHVSIRLSCFSPELIDDDSVNNAVSNNLWQLEVLNGLITGFLIILLLGYIHYIQTKTLTSLSTRHRIHKLE